MCQNLPWQIQRSQRADYGRRRGGRNRSCGSAHKIGKTAREGLSVKNNFVKLDFHKAERNKQIIRTVLYSSDSFFVSSSGSLCCKSCSWVCKLKSLSFRVLSFVWYCLSFVASDSPVIPLLWSCCWVTRCVNSSWTTINLCCNSLSLEDSPFLRCSASALLCTGSFKVCNCSVLDEKSGHVKQRSS